MWKMHGGDIHECVGGPRKKNIYASVKKIKYVGAPKIFPVPPEDINWNSPYDLVVQKVPVETLGTI